MIARDRPRPTRHWPLLLLLLLAALAEFRTLEIGHLSDDWAIHSHLARDGLAGEWTGPWLGLSGEILLYYRPLASTAYAIESALFGVNPWPAHLHHLLWHLAGVALVYALLRQLRAGRAPAFFAGLLFAWNPFIAGATGWLAARCGIMAGTLTLLAVSAYLRSRASPASARGWRVVSLIAGVAAVGAQESGYLALVTPLLIDLVLDGPPKIGSLVRRHLPFFVAIIALVALRFYALGTVQGGYPVSQGVAAGGDAGALAFRNLGIALFRLIVPQPRWYFTNGDLIQWATAGLMIALLVGSVLLRRVRRDESDAPGGRVLLLIFIANVGLLAAVVDPALSPDTSHRWYVALAAFSGLVALVSAPLWRSRFTAVVLVALTGIQLCGHLRVQNEFLDADRAVQDVLRQTRSALLAKPTPKGPAFISSLPRTRLGLSTYRWGVSEALRPPFQPADPPMRTYPIHRHMWLGAHTSWRVHPPVELLCYLAGHEPLVLSLRPREGIGRRIERVMLPDRTEAAALLKRHFDTGGFTIRAPAGGSRITYDARLAIPVDLAVTGLRNVELFVFTPYADLRLPVPIENGAVTVDLGPGLQDFATFRREPTIFFIVPIGYRDDPTRPVLGPLLRDLRPTEYTQGA